MGLQAVLGKGEFLKHGFPRSFQSRACGFGVPASQLNGFQNDAVHPVDSHLSAGPGLGQQVGGAVLSGNDHQQRGGKNRPHHGKTSRGPGNGNASFTIVRSGWPKGKGRGSEPAGNGVSIVRGIGRGCR